MPGPGAWWRGWCGLAPVHTCQVASPVSRRQQPRHHVDTQLILSRYLPTLTTTSTKHRTKRSVPPSPFCDCLQLCECKQGKVAALGWAGLGWADVSASSLLHPSSSQFSVRGGEWRDLAASAGRASVRGASGHQLSVPRCGGRKQNNNNLTLDPHILTTRRHGHLLDPRHQPQGDPQLPRR